MRNLSRAFALTAALILTALAGLSPASASSYGSCVVRCYGSGPPPVIYTFGSTQEECCSGNYANHCPAGSTPVTLSWNYMRCM